MPVSEPGAVSRRAAPALTGRLGPGLLALCLAASPAGGAAGAAAAAGEKWGTPPATLALTLDPEPAAVAEGSAFTVSGTSDAPPGSRIVVTAGGLSFFTRVADDGSWTVEWTVPLAPGTHRLEAEVRLADGRAARVHRELAVEPAGRLPRRPDESPPLAVTPPAAPADADFREATDRWRLVPPPYELHAEPGRWNPYDQNVLKGDFPVRGDDLFFVLTAVSDTLAEGRTLPTAAGVSTAGTDITFFGGEEQRFGAENLFVSGDLFKGDTAFKPFEWRVKATLAVNFNRLEVQETTLVKPDVRLGVVRNDNWLALQELFFEAKVLDLGPSYDFASIRAGIQPFNSDFRGFIFDDMNLGVRFFGNFASNRNQFNAAFFERLEKDTNSGLNTFSLRDQQVAILNFYRQDFLVRGFTSQWSVHYLRDEASFHFDENRFLARPDPAGDLTPHEVEAVYLGWTTFGHVGRLNLDTALYYVFGEDSLNPLAGRELVLRGGEFAFVEAVDIEAWMAAVELSIDRDWMRPRVAVFYASGDADLNDRDAEGFDSIFDSPAFAGGGFSFWNRLAIRLAGTGVSLVSRGSLLPNLRTSKEEGQPNFVNPGLLLGSVGLDAELTPKLRATVNLNYLRFDATEVLEGILFQGPLEKEIGWDLGLGARWRPYLNQNLVVLAGAALFVPGAGFDQIFEDEGELYQLFGSVTLTF